MSNQPPLKSSAPSGSADPARFPERPLPPVEPPSGGFIMQLFLIPMIIVTIIVMVWLAVNWLAHMGSDPYELARSLKHVNDKSWQDAATMADLLRNPRYEELKTDRRLAASLADALQMHLAAGGMSDQEVKLRIFICRALGEFRVDEGVPVLVEAARLERQPPEISVRRTALEALAVLASNLGPEHLRRNEEVMQVALEASSERETGQLREERAKLRERAAFTLGVLGGDVALDRLATMLGDAYPNARYNAATGLARHGDVRALPVLLEMLDPDNPRAVSDEQSKEGRDWKRLQVVVNGIRASEQLAQQNDSADLGALKDALQELTQSDLNSLASGTRRGVRLDAQEALHQLGR